MSGRLLPFRRPATPATRPAAGPSSGDRNLVGGNLTGTAAHSRPLAAPRFRDLIAPHIDAAYSLARYLARDATAGEDIAQEALLKAFRNLDSLRGDPKPWLLAIVRNAYFDWRRRGDDHMVGGEEADDALANLADPEQDTAETTLIRRGDVAQLRAAIEAIPEPFREALVLRELEELSYREVAEVTGVPMGTVMSRLSRARHMLAERMGVVGASA